MGMGDNMGGGSVIDLSDFIGKSSSSDALPGWGASAIQKLTIGQKNKKGQIIGPAMLGPAWTGYRSAVQGLDAAPAHIENARNLLNQQFARDIQSPVTDAVRSAIRSGAGGGILNSSAFGDALGGVTSQALKSAEGQQTQSNLWAQQSLLDNLMNRLKASRGFAQDQGGLLGLTRKSASSSIDPGAAAALLAKIMDV